MLITAHAEILYFLIAFIVVFSISDIYMLYLLATKQV